MEPLAIIGMACRFPGARNLDGFWRLLRDGVDAIGEVPPDRWDFHQLPDTSRWGGFLDRVDAFDPSFFGVSPREAAYMDPQQRLLLEVAWEALEDAGLPLEKCSGRPTGVFVGISTYDYGALAMNDAERIADGYVNTGGALSIAANRISYVFDFRGPSMAVDTACSSSLTAAHLACQSLWRGESEVALAGGVNLILSPALSVGFSKLKAMASDGRCKTFDARADGYVRGEGAGFVVLKPLANALRDGDRVYAVVRGTALNQDGRTNGMTAPNGLSQEALVRRALEVAGVEPARIGYVEAHGTGTPLGDPIELTALGTVLAKGRDPESRCAVGSVKTNIGHLEAAAGVAGLIKLALALHHREIPPNLHFQEPNPHIPFDLLPLVVPTTLAPWPDELRPAVGGVSSFGFGGTNVHIVVEEPPSSVAASVVGEMEDDAGRAYLLPLSAKSPDALPAMARAYRDALQSSPGPLPGSVSDASLRDLAYAAGRRRTHHEHRLVVVAHSRDELAEHLNAFLDGEARPGLSAGRATQGRRRKLVFVFPGQGAQWFGMARGLLRREPVFRKALEECEEVIRREVGWSLRDELHAEAAQSRLGAVDVIQPALFAIQVGLAALWRSWGIAPDAVVGHSMGEVAAACVAGVLSLDDGARVICRRSRLLRKTSGLGAMAAVELSIDQARDALAGYEDRLSIAVNNSPSSTVLSGDPAALDDIIKKLEGQGVFCRRVKVDVASHSPQMDPLRADLLEVLAGVHSRPGAVPLYSTVTGKASGELDLDAGYWVRNLREPVLFSLAVERLLADGHAIFLELSPHPILLPAVQQTLRHLGKEGTVLPSLRREEDEQAAMLGSLGALFALGKPVRWDVVSPIGRLVRLPSYPWQRERFWLEKRSKKDASGSRHPLLGTHIRSAADGTHFWDVALDVETVPALAAHRIEGCAILPAAAYLEMVLAAAHEAFGPGRHAVESVELKRALLLPDQGAARMQLVVSPGLSGTAAFQFFGSAAGSDGGLDASVVHATGTLRMGSADAPPAPSAHVSPAEVQARCAETVSASQYYDRARKRGLDLGATFQVVHQAWRRDGEAIARLRPSSEVLAVGSTYRVHPALIDACFQALAAALPSSASNDMYMPVSVGRLTIGADFRPERAQWSHAVVHDAVADGDVRRGDVYLLDEAGNVLLAATGVGLTRLGDDGRRARQSRDDWFYEVRWQPAPLPPSSPGRRRSAGSWILLVDERGVGEALRERMEARGDTCITVTRAGAYESAGDRRYRLDPAQPQHFRQLLRDALGNGAPACRGVVHLWSLDMTPVGEGGPALETALEWGCLSALHAVQSLAITGGREKPRLWLVTSGAQAIGPGPAPVAVDQSPLWGLARTVAHEHPELGCTTVDLGPGGGNGDAAALFAEICADDREEQIALRGSARYVARLARFSPAAVPASYGIAADATYLLTGELEGLGLAAAAWLVDQGARNIVLAGAGGDTPEVQTAKAAMQRAGAKVTVAVADVAEARELAALLAEIDGGRAPLRGVIHAAGIADDGILLQMDAARLKAALASRLRGPTNLDALTSGHPLDFFILLSSAAGVLGSSGQGCDAATGTFLDALAHRRRSLGWPALSIDWGRASQVGRATPSDGRGPLAARETEGLAPAQAVAALVRLWGARATQVSVTPVDWAEWRQAHAAAAASPLLADFRDVEEAGEAAPPVRLTAAIVRAAEPAERQRIVESHLRREVARVLGLAVAKLDVTQPLSALGIDSLMAVELKTQVEIDLQVSVPLIKVIQGPSVAELAALLLNLLAGVDSSLIDAAYRPPPKADGQGDSLFRSLMSRHPGDGNG